jgi:threonine dehydrogenase-like Zn-dependent dehydrogenase
LIATRLRYRSVRAVILNSAGAPELAEIAEPEGPDVLHVLACGLCGSDVEKLGRAREGTVLGHEVVAEADGKRVALVHHQPCGECERCLAGHESTCEKFGAATIQPGGFAERVAALGGWVDVPDDVDDALGSYAEPLACVLRGAERVPRGEVLVLGGGFVGRLLEAVLRQRGDTVYVRDTDPARSGPEPPGRVGALVVCAPRAGRDAVEAVEPGGSILVFADAGELDSAEIYRREITVAGSRSATRRHLKEAVVLLPRLDLPEPLVLPLERFDEGLAAYRSREALKVVFRP